MTIFQRAALSLVAQAWLKELSNPSHRISGRTTTVKSRNGTYSFVFYIEELSLTSVNMRERDSNLKFFSEKMEKNRYVFVSEDDRYRRINIYEKDASYLRGLDGNDYRFEARMQSWNEVVIDDNQDLRRSPFLYRLT